jgi:hypothetical protein
LLREAVFLYLQRLDEAYLRFGDHS